MTSTLSLPGAPFSCQKNVNVNYDCSDIRAISFSKIEVIVERLSKQQLILIEQCVLNKDDRLWEDY